MTVEPECGPPRAVPPTIRHIEEVGGHRADDQCHAIPRQRGTSATSRSTEQRKHGDLVRQERERHQIYDICVNDAPDPALPADERPVDHTPVHTTDLPDTPTRDRNIPATAWIQAPATLLAAGDDLQNTPVANYKRKIGSWLLWRAGPAKGDARYVALDPGNLARCFTFRLTPDGLGLGVGPSGETHARFRMWKEDLRDHG